MDYTFNDLLPLDELRGRLLRVLRCNPQSSVASAKEIGISILAFRNFLKSKTKSLDFKTHLLIENFIYRKEKEYEIHN